MSESNLPIYVATDEFLAELRELGYEASIELDDLIDFLDEDPSLIEQMQPTIMLMDELSFVNPAASNWMYTNVTNGRPT